MGSKGEVTVCVPIYASPYLLQTLRSISDQHYKNFNVLISVDKSDVDISPIISRWKKENKDIIVQMFYQRKRLDWVRNINFLLKRLETNYFCILPHDDLIHPDYLLKTVQILNDNPKTCAVYSDIRGFGTKRILIAQDSITGTKFARIEQFLKYYFSAVSLRGVVNKNILSDRLLLRENAMENFAVDTLWGMQKALRGELVRIPEILYYKRYLNHSVHYKWSKWSTEKKIDGWLCHCSDCSKLLEEEFFGDKLYSLKELCMYRGLHKDQLPLRIKLKRFGPYIRNVFLLRELVRSIK